MAMVVDITAEQLREAGRDDAADILLFLGGARAENDWQHVGSALERLKGIQEQIGAVIRELSSGGDSGGNTAPKMKDS
jgi:hypothetical protein